MSRCWNSSTARCSAPSTWRAEQAAHSTPCSPFHVCKMETLQEAYQMAKSNDGAPGIDGVTFEAIEEGGAESFLVQIRDELVTNTHQPMQARKKGDSQGRGQESPRPVYTDGVTD